MSNRLKQAGHAARYILTWVGGTFAVLWLFARCSTALGAVAERHREGVGIALLVFIAVAGLIFVAALVRAAWTEAGEYLDDREARHAR